MKLETKFDLGDTVYAVWKTREKLHMPCSACDGTGSINLKDEIYRCPKCYGSGGREEYTNRDRYYIDQISTVGLVCAEASIDKDHNEIIYMIKSTGIGSGTTWHEKDLFGSEKEALAYCDKKNKEII